MKLELIEIELKLELIEIEWFWSRMELLVLTQVRHKLDTS